MAMAIYSSDRQAARQPGQMLLFFPVYEQQLRSIDHAAWPAMGMTFQPIKRHPPHTLGFPGVRNGIPPPAIPPECHFRPCGENETVRHNDIVTRARDHGRSCIRSFADIEVTS